MGNNIYIDKVRGCWMGKCLAGAIGMPFEGVPFTLDLSEEQICVSEVPNDDLELQIVWLDALKQHGVNLTSEKLGEYWLNKIQHGCDEYSIAIHNMKHGIMPPASGWNNNFFADGMGATIRSEIWALVFPERPDAAGFFAQQDAEADHWGDGVRGEIFMAEAEAYACVHSDIESALRFALERQDHESRLYKTIAKVFSMFDSGVSDESAKNFLLLTEQRRSNFTDCVMNLSFIVDSLLRGKGDFLKTILSVISYGRDTDCTAASCGAFLGITKGQQVFPKKWISKLKNELDISDYVKIIPNVPLTMESLVSQTVNLHERLKEQLPEETYLPYQPYKPINHLPKIDQAKWLILDENEYDISQIKAYIEKNGKCPDELRDQVYSFSSLFLDLSPFAKNYNTLNLFAFLNINNSDVSQMETVISVTADVGMTLYVDGRRVINHHSRQKMVPSFHRAEGGLAFLFPLETDRPHLFHWKLYNCSAPVQACVMFGNTQNDHLDGFEFKI